LIDAVTVDLPGFTGGGVAQAPADAGLWGR
jgi:hypothetical protein